MRKVAVVGRLLIMMMLANTQCRDTNDQQEIDRTEKDAVNPVIFEPMTQVKMTRAKALVTSYLDFQPYVHSIRTLAKYVQDFHQDLSSLMETNDPFSIMTQYGATSDQLRDHVMPRDLPTATNKEAFIRYVQTCQTQSLSLQNSFCYQAKQLVSAEANVKQLLAGVQRLSERFDATIDRLRDEREAKATGGLLDRRKRSLTQTPPSLASLYLSLFPHKVAGTIARAAANSDREGAKDEDMSNTEYENDFLNEYKSTRIGVAQLSTQFNSEQRETWNNTLQEYDRIHVLGPDYPEDVYPIDMGVFREYLRQRSVHEMLDGCENGRQTPTYPPICQLSHLFNKHIQALAKRFTAEFAFMESEREYFSPPIPRPTEILQTTTCKISTQLGWDFGNICGERRQKRNARKQKEDVLETVYVKDENLKIEIDAVKMSLEAQTKANKLFRPCRDKTKGFLCTMQTQLQERVKDRVKNLFGKLALLTDSEIMIKPERRKKPVQGDTETPRYKTVFGRAHKQARKLSRRKRSGGILGQLMNAVFGTGGDDDGNKEVIDQLEENINKLEDVNDAQNAQIREAFGNINMTRIAVRNNTAMINELSVSVVKLNNDLKRISVFAERALLQVYGLLSVQSKLDRAEIALVTSRGDVEHIYQVMSAMATGRVSPTVISPVALREVLQNVVTRLASERSLRLPVNPNYNIWAYYRSMRMQAVVRRSRLMMVLDVPLADAKLELDVFRIHNLPSLHVQLNISFTYQLEGKYLAVSKDQKYLAIPTEAEVLMCLTAGGTRCTINSALYPTKDNRFCAYALYRRDLKTIKTKCLVKTAKQESNLAYDLGGDMWAVSAIERDQLRIRCLGKTYLKDVYPPITFIKLPDGCEATGTHLYIPARSTVNIKSKEPNRDNFFIGFNQQYQKEEMYDMWTKIGVPPRMTMDEARALAKRLPILPPMTQETLNQDLSEFRVNRSYPAWQKHKLSWWESALMVIGAIVGFAVLMCMCYGLCCVGEVTIAQRIGSKLSTKKRTRPFSAAVSRHVPVKAVAGQLITQQPTVPEPKEIPLLKPTKKPKKARAVVKYRKDEEMVEFSPPRLGKTTVNKLYTPPSIALGLSLDDNE